MTPEQRKSNRRLGLILLTIALAFGFGFIAKVLLLAS